MGYPVWGGRNKPSTSNSASTIYAANYSTMYDIAQAINNCASQEVTVDFTGADTLWVQQVGYTYAQDIVINKIVSFVNGHGTMIYNNGTSLTYTTTATWTANTNINKTGTWSANSTTISIADTSGLQVGMNVTLTNGSIREGTYITAISPNVSVTINSPTCWAETSVNVLFQGSVVTFGTSPSVGSIVKGTGIDATVIYVSGTTASLSNNPLTTSGTNVSVNITGSGAYAADFNSSTNYTSGQRMRWRDNKIYVANSAITAASSPTFGTGNGKFRPETGRIIFNKKANIDGLTFFTGDSIIFNGVNTNIVNCTFRDCQCIVKGFSSTIENNTFELLQDQGVYGRAEYSNPDNIATWNSATSSYTTTSYVLYDDGCKYKGNSATIPAGTLPSDTTKWQPVDLPAMLTIAPFSNVIKNFFKVSNNQQRMFGIKTIFFGDLITIRDNQFLHQTCTSYSKSGLYTIIGNEYTISTSFNYGKICGNYFRVSYSNAGIHLQGKGYKWYCVISENYYEGYRMYPYWVPTVAVMEFLLAGNTPGLVLSNNRFINCPNGAIQLVSTDDGGQENINISNNVFLVNSSYRSSGGAANLLGTKRMNFSGNHVYMLADSGISSCSLIWNSRSNGASYVNNTFGMDNFGSSSTNKGISVRDGSNIFIDQNRFINSSVLTKIDMSSSTQGTNAAMDW